MSEHRICIPLDEQGMIHGRMGQAHSVATCTVDAQGVRDWTEHVVNWHWTYGVDIPGVNHPRVIRFLRAHDVDTVVADEVCPGMQRAFTSMGIEVHDHATGSAREAALVFAA